MQLLPIQDADRAFRSGRGQCFSYRGRRSRVAKAATFDLTAFVARACVSLVDSLVDYSFPNPRFQHSGGYARVHQPEFRQDGYGRATGYPER